MIHLVKRVKELSQIENKTKLLIQLDSFLNEVDALYRFGIISYKKALDIKSCVIVIQNRLYKS